jgi:MFS family permease
MLVTAAAFSTVVLAVHVAAVAFAFGIVLAAPLIGPITDRLDPAATVWWHRVRKALGRRIVNPGLTLVVIAGVVLASDEHKWSSFFVQWGVGAAVVLGALEGSFVIPQSGKLAAEAELAVGAGAAGRSDDYLRRRRRLSQVELLMAALVLATIYLMSVQP